MFDFLFCVTHKREKKYVGRLWLGVWLLLVLRCTLWGRTPTEFAKIELAPFWCLTEAWCDKNYIDWYLIISNVILFFPLGLILPLFFANMRCIYKTVGIGCICSAMIESIQLLFHVGWFEIDDVINNTIGCMLGYTICILVFKFLRMNAKRYELRFAIVLWIAVIIFIVIAVLDEQPLLNNFYYFLCS